MPYRLLFVAILAAAFSLNAAATGNTSPQELVKTTTDRVLGRLADDREAIENSPDRLFEIVDEIIIPHFDFERMSRRVLGKAWKRASPEQQSQFVKEFRTLLVHTYATALKIYSDERIEYLPPREKEGGKETTIRTQIIQSGSPPVPINYRMYRRDDGWKVFDITIDGVSLVINYRSTFKSEIRKNGVDGLIARLAKHNSKQD
jgi:phospholipid transport system substrate-binding protein